MKFSTVILTSVAASSFLAESQEANAFLSRTRRAWGFMEELKDGNWERECIEEDCNANEAYEVVDDEEQGERLFDLVNDCKARHNTRENQRECVGRGIPAVTGATGFQIPVNCGSDYFRPGAEWPLQNMLVGAQSGTTVRKRVSYETRLCQNNFGKDHYFATLFNTDTNLPVYSAVKIRRVSKGPTYPRPGNPPKVEGVFKSIWSYMCKGLCGTSTPPPYTSFYCNLDEVESPNDCDKWQPQHEDYLENTAKFGIDRGHLMPNALLNQVRDAANSTFTLTNVSPQFGDFNKGAWNQLECMVRKYMEEEINNEDVWIIVGTYGKIGSMNDERGSTKNKVDIPEFYWHAFCYTGTNNSNYSWIYMQKNAKDQKQSSGDNFMSVESFSKTYYGGAAIFDSVCQKPSRGFGNWNKVINDWSGYRRQWNC